MQEEDIRMVASAVVAQTSEYLNKDETRARTLVDWWIFFCQHYPRLFL